MARSPGRSLRLAGVPGRSGDQTRGGGDRDRRPVLLSSPMEGAGSIWALERTWNVVRIDTQTNKVVGRFPVTVDPSAKRVNAVFGGDSVWFSGGPTLTRIRVADGTTEQIDTGGGVPLRARAGLMWGASAKELWALDMASGKVVRRIPVSAVDVVSLNLDDDSIWVGVLRTSRTGALLRLDQASGAVRGELGGLTYPARIEIGFRIGVGRRPGQGVRCSGSRILFHPTSYST